MRSALLLLSLGLGGCIPSDLWEDFWSDSGDPLADTAETGDTAEDRGTGELRGTVRVALYREGADGLTEALSWEDYGGAFPFGAIYVAAVTTDPETGETRYHAETVIQSPSTEGDPYTLTVDLDDAESVSVYASLDWWPDGVLGTGEPVGTHPDAVTVLEDGAVEGVDVVIDAPPLPTGGGGGGSYVAISGDLVLNRPYTGGVTRILLYDSAGRGPSYVTSVTPTPTPDGATGTYALAVGANAGAARLIGAWDDDRNGLIDPTDVWGAHVVAGENGNPITVGATDLTARTVEIPFGLPPAFSPFVRLEGTLGYAPGFETLPAGTTVYVTALRSRPAEDFDVASLQEGYDWSSFTGAELVGTGLPYVMVTPANAVAYLWVYADLDNDGILNEAGEPVASYGTNGRIATGTENQQELDLLLQTVVE